MPPNSENRKTVSPTTDIEEPRAYLFICVSTNEREREKERKKEKSYLTKFPESVFTGPEKSVCLFFFLTLLLKNHTIKKKNVSLSGYRPKRKSRRLRGTRNRTSDNNTKSRTTTIV